MKRLIKFHSPYESDGAKFSSCSTKFEVLPELVDDSAGLPELKALAEKLGLRVGEKALTFEVKEYSKHTQVTHAMDMVEKIVKPKMFCGDKQEFSTVYIGFVTLQDKGTLKPTNKIVKRITKDQAQEIINNGEYGISQVGEHAQEDKNVLVKEGWNYYSVMRLLGYHHEQFEEVANVEDYGFEDDTTRCDECGMLDSNDDGYVYNFRHVEDLGMLGTNCGCFDEHCKLNFADTYANNPKQAIERAAATDLENEGKIERLETFIGGMVDGRGGYFEGKPTREGTPEAILREYQEKMPEKTFMFIHEESGQFQQYFSIAEIMPEKKAA